MSSYDNFVDELPTADTARAVSRLSVENQNQLLTRLPPEAAAELIDELPDIQAAAMVENLDPLDAAAIVHELPSDERADLVGDLDADTAEAILRQLPRLEAEQVRALSEYRDDVAGGLMVTEYLAYPEDASVAEVVDDMRANAETYQHYESQYAYVIDSAQRLRGVLRLRDLLLASATQPIRELMLLQPMNIKDTTELDRLREFFDSHPYFAIPVTNADHQLAGCRSPQ